MASAYYFADFVSLLFGETLSRMSAKYSRDAATHRQTTLLRRRRLRIRRVSHLLHQDMK